MSSINPEITGRMALGPDEGYDFKLVGVRGTGRAGAESARNYVIKEGVRRCDVTSAEYAGRDDGGNPVYLVTWKTAWAS